MPLVAEDPILVTFACDALLAIDKVKEAVVLLADKIKEFPYLVTLLLKQAQAFLKYEYYEYALRLARISVDLCPESFECWIALAESYFHLRIFKMALVALDIAPCSPDINYISPVGANPSMEFTHPKKQDSNEFHSYIMIKTAKIDFIKKKEEEDANR